MAISYEIVYIVYSFVQIARARVIWEQNIPQTERSGKQFHRRLQQQRRRRQRRQIKKKLDNLTIVKTE